MKGSDGDRVFAKLGLETLKVATISLEEILARRDETPSDFEKMRACVGTPFSMQCSL